MTTVFTTSSFDISAFVPVATSAPVATAFSLAASAPRDSGTYHIILDHLSLSWGNDEIIDLYHAHDVTVQWCTIEESDDQGHSKGAHNFGLISAAEDNGAVSVHHNLWAHHARRVPCMAPYRENAASDFCNNLIYNCRGGYVDDGHGVRAKSPVNLYQNYYRRGPQTQDRLYPYALSPHMSYYVRDNFFEDWGYQGHPRHWKWGGPEPAPRWIQFNNNGRELDAPAKTPEIELVDAKAAFELILAKPAAGPATGSPNGLSMKSKPKPAFGAATPRSSQPTDGSSRVSRKTKHLKTPTATGCRMPGRRSHNLDFSNPNDADQCGGGRRIE